MYRTQEDAKNYNEYVVTCIIPLKGVGKVNCCKSAILKLYQDESIKNRFVLV
jgi:hypothetical protein